MKKIKLVSNFLKTKISFIIYQLTERNFPIIGLKTALPLVKML